MEARAEWTTQKTKTVESSRGNWAEYERKYKNCKKKKEKEMKPFSVCLLLIFKELQAQGQTKKKRESDL